MSSRDQVSAAVEEELGDVDVEEEELPDPESVLGPETSASAHDPGAKVVAPQALTTPSTSVPVVTRRMTAKEKKAMAGTTTASQAAVGRQLFDGSPAIGMKLYRVNPLTGGRVELGHWNSRTVDDWHVCAGWVNQWSGGGDYILSAHPIGNFGLVYNEKGFELPGPPLDPLPMRQAATQQDPTSGLGALGLGFGGKPLDIQSMLMLKMFGLGAPAAPPVPVSDPRIDSLVAEQQRLNAELAASRRELAEEKNQNRFDEKFETLRREIKDNKPEKGLGERLVENLPTLLTAATTLVTTLGMRQEKMFAELQKSSDARATETWKAVEKISDANKRDPDGAAKSVQIMATTVSTVLAGAARMMTTMAPQGSPGWEMARELLGRIGNAADRYLPMLAIGKLAETDPAAARMMMQELESEPDPNALPKHAQDPALPQRAPPPAAQPPRSAGAVRPSGAVPTGETEPPKRIPIAQILVMQKLVLAEADPQKVVDLWRAYIDFCEKFDSMPPAMRSSGLWARVKRDPVEGIAILLDAVHQGDLVIDAEYAEALREAAGVKIETVRDAPVPSAAPVEAPATPAAPATQATTTATTATPEEEPECTASVPEGEGEVYVFGGSP